MTPAVLRAVIEGDADWMSRGECVGTPEPDAFFPSRGEQSTEARAMCARCEVRVECLEWALRHGEKFGIWGGLSERERRRIRRQRSIARWNVS